MLEDAYKYNSTTLSSLINFINPNIANRREFPVLFTTFARFKSCHCEKRSDEAMLHFVRNDNYKL